MASLLRRIQTASKGWLNDLMAPAEDPRRTFTNAFERQRELLAKVRQAQSTIADSKTRLQAKTEQERAMLPELMQQARQALIGGREDLARHVLRRRQLAVLELQVLEEQLNDVRNEEQKLALVEHQLATRLESFQARQEMIEARYSAAEAQVRINEALAGVSQELGDWGIALEQAAQKTERMQARAAAINHLVDAGVLDLAALESDDPDQRQPNFALAQAVDQELDALRRTLP